MTEAAIFRVVLLHSGAIIQTCGRHTNWRRVAVHGQTYIQSPEQYEESDGEARLLSIPLNV